MELSIQTFVEVVYFAEKSLIKISIKVFIIQ